MSRAAFCRSRARLTRGQCRLVSGLRLGIREELSTQLFGRASSRHRERDHTGRLGQRRHRLGDRMVAVFRGVLVEHRRVRASVPGAVH